MLFVFGVLYFHTKADGRGRLSGVSSSVEKE